MWSNPGINRPPTSPIRNPEAANASSTVETSSISVSPARKAYAAVVNARRTSITTTTPEAPRAPSMPLTIRTAMKRSDSRMAVGPTSSLQRSPPRARRNTGLSYKAHPRLPEQHGGNFHPSPQGLSDYPDLDISITAASYRWIIPRRFGQHLLPTRPAGSVRVDQTRAHFRW